MTKKKIKVLFFVAEFFRLQGSQRSLLALLRELPAEGIEPVVVFPGEGRCTEAYRRAGLDVRVLEAPEELGAKNKVLLRLSAFGAARVFLTRVVGYNLRLARLARELRVDAFHFNTPRAMLLGGLSSLIARRPRVLHVRGQLHVLGRAHRFVSQLFASRMILVSESLLSHVYPVFRRRCTTVHTGIDERDVPGLTDGAPASLPVEVGGRAVVCAFGAVCPFKGYHHLVEAARLVVERNGTRPPVFLAVGELVDEPYYEYLRGLVEEYGLTNFHFVGWQERAVDFYRAADVVVLPSVEGERLRAGGLDVEVKGNEGLPRAVLEAMYMGKAVVATRVAGTAEQIVDGESGVLVPPGDAPSMAEAIL
ncbi:MAG TPA: glycosyltransferase, partial [Pyrinomonadaceae bacterium]|nr:glycosyltransferase [Pyrinomonadaceae bacterium]